MVYDVLYRNRTHTEKLIARGLGREAACDVARAEARRRHVGRMFAAGSDLSPISEMVLIVETRQQSL